jgi:hypothetical protein
MLHRSERWPARVRPVDKACRAGGYNSHTTSVPESLSDFSRPCNKTPPKTQSAQKENPTQNLAKQHQTDQDLTSSTTTQRHTSPAVHLRQTHKLFTLVRPVKSSGQTGVTWAARDEQHQRVNSLKSNSRSAKSFHRFAQDFGDSRNTS